MRTLLRQHPLAALLAILAAVLVIVIGLEAGLGGMQLWSSPQAAAPRPAASAEAKLVPPLASVNPEQAYPEAAARPLFSPTRRPAPPAATAASNMVRGQFTLQGVIAVGDHRIALLREKSSGRVHRVEKGREVNGLTLIGVENDKVILAQGSEHEEVALLVQKGAAMAAAPPAAPGAAGPFATPAAQPRPAAAPPPGAAPPGAAPAAPVAAPPVPNPANRSGFGPTPSAAAPAPEQAAPLTPEELLARRRARRQQTTRGQE